MHLDCIGHFDTKYWTFAQIIQCNLCNQQRLSYNPCGHHWIFYIAFVYSSDWSRKHLTSNTLMNHFSFTLMVMFDRYLFGCSIRLVDWSLETQSSFYLPLPSPPSPTASSPLPPPPFPPHFPHHLLPHPILSLLWFYLVK